MEITVTGHGRVTLAPERAVLPISVVHDGDDLATSLGAVTRATTTLAAALDAEPSVVDLVVPPARTCSSWQRYDEQGGAARVQYSASVEILATFTDFAAVARFVGTHGQDADVRIGTVRWELSDQTREDADTRALTDAMAAARRRAETIAGGGVELVEVADPGLLRGVPGPDRPQAGGMRMMAMAGGASQEYDVRPDDIEVTTSVHARFHSA